MFVAVDSNGNEVNIWNAEKGTAYFCPFCHQLMIQKRGEERLHHFAHMGEEGGNGCTERWDYDKTEWHIEWQMRFPAECREKIVHVENQKHIADVLINDLVIEFQHSPISISEFRERNDFYRKAGYKVLWVFDLIKEWENNKIDNPGDNKYSWSSPSKVFRDMDLKKENVTVYFQFPDEDNKDTFVLERVTGGYKQFTQFYTDMNHGLSVPDFVLEASNRSSEYFLNRTEETHQTASGGQTILSLWKPDYAWMIVYNICTKKTMIIFGNGGNIEREYSGKIVGKYASKNSAGKYTYSDKYVVKDAEKDVWQFVKANFRTV